MNASLTLNLRLTEIAEGEEVLPGEGAAIEDCHVPLGASLLALNALMIDGSLESRVHLEFSYGDHPAVVISAARIIEVEGVCGSAAPTHGSRYVYTFTPGASYEAFQRFAYEARVHVHSSSPL